jgi:hypothetical protein
MGMLRAKRLNTQRLNVLNEGTLVERGMKIALRACWHLIELWEFWVDELDAAERRGSRIRRGQCDSRSTKYIEHSGVLHIRRLILALLSKMTLNLRPSMKPKLACGEADGYL